MLKDADGIPVLPERLHQIILQKWKPAKIEYVTGCQLLKEDLKARMVGISLPDDICGSNFRKHPFVDINVHSVGPNSEQVVYLYGMGDNNEYALQGNWADVVKNDGIRTLESGVTLYIWAFLHDDNDTVIFAMDVDEEEDSDEDSEDYKKPEEEEDSEDEKPEKEKLDEEELKPDEKPDITINKATSDKKPEEEQGESPFELEKLLGLRANDLSLFEKSMEDMFSKIDLKEIKESVEKLVVDLESFVGKVQDCLNEVSSKERQVESKAEELGLKEKQLEERQKQLELMFPGAN